MTLDELGIELIDECRGRAPREPFADGAEESRPRKPPRKPPRSLEEERRPSGIDDPVRMYLTQMGEIPLLTREQEIALAKKIEMTRMHFRRSVLESDYCLQQAVEILAAGGRRRPAVRPHDEDLHRGEPRQGHHHRAHAGQPRDGRARCSSATGTTGTQCNAPRRRQRPAGDIAPAIWRRRRRAAKLLEELSLRTSKIQPLMKKLQHISDKMERAASSASPTADANRHAARGRGR